MLSYPVIKTIERRKSVRTYFNRQLTPETLDKLKEYISTLSNPFGADVRVSMVHKKLDANGEKLGTYGMVKGATTFLGVSVAPGDKALLAAGFQFEDLILYATSLDLGTVWMAATFTRARFQKAMDIPADFLFPAISPVGYPKEKRFVERIVRKTIGSDHRKPWREIFFNGDFSTPLSQAEAGSYATALEMVRIAPSATNAQPWRVLRLGDTFHFYETHKDNAREDDILIKQVDLGIAAFHFFKTLQSQGIEGKFVDMPPVAVSVPSTYHYVISFTILK